MWGVLVVLGLPWNSTRQDPETGLYWVRPGKPVRHLLQRIRNLRTVTLPEGFVAMVERIKLVDLASPGPSDAEIEAIVEWHSDLWPGVDRPEARQVVVGFRPESGAS